MLCVLEYVFNNKYFYVFFNWAEEKQKKKKQQQAKKIEASGSTLQRSKTFVSLLFKSGRKRDRSASKDRKDTSKQHQTHLDNEPGMTFYSVQIYTCYVHGLKERSISGLTDHVP